LLSTISARQGTLAIRDEFEANRTSAASGTESVICVGEDPQPAGHHFATYFENSRLIRLQFEVIGS
jgi:hypothetical protein